MGTDGRPGRDRSIDSAAGQRGGSDVDRDVLQGGPGFPTPTQRLSAMLTLAETTGDGEREETLSWSMELVSVPVPTDEVSLDESSGPVPLVPAPESPQPASEGIDEVPMLPVAPRPPSPMSVTSAAPPPAPLSAHGFLAPIGKTEGPPPGAPSEEVTEILGPGSPLAAELAPVQTSLHDATTAPLPPHLVPGTPTEALPVVERPAPEAPRSLPPPRRPASSGLQISTAAWAGVFAALLLIGMGALVLLLLVSLG